MKVESLPYLKLIQRSLRKEKTSLLELSPDIDRLDEINNCTSLIEAIDQELKQIENEKDHD